MSSGFLNERGVSLTEILVAVVILAILSSLAAPGVSRWVESYRVKATSRQLISDLQFAKMKAVTEKKNYQVFFNTATAQYRVEKSDGTNNGPWRSLADASNPYYARGVTLAKNFVGNVVVFTPIGQASPSGTVTVNTGSQTRSVSVEPSGRISVG